jgi:peptidyl-prolyl cis-trans isomerase SurA
LRFFVGLILAASLATACTAPAAMAQDQKVIVTVNDRPITSYDVTQRINLWKLLGIRDGSRKKALNDLIDDYAKVEEAKKFGADPKEKDIDLRMKELAKGLGTDDAGLKSRLRKANIAPAAMRQYVAGQIAFGRLLSGKEKVDVKATDAEVERKLAGYRAEIDGKVSKFMADPRMKPVTVYTFQEINFPIDTGGQPLTPELLQSRAIEANQYVSKFRGCGSAKAAASGIFNVRIGKKLEADGAKLPKQLKAIVDRSKPGKALGPMRSAAGLQVLGYCGVRKIVPPRPKVQYPTRQQAEAAVLNEKYEQVVTRFSSQYRKGLLIEYRDPSFAE